ncbi:MAG TPA: peptidoglycan editing factor PgeF [Candidatus Acidoferrales bacterium]|nr:peptidoglycan editing factor PgeF [Candidatus Acidoferrales bacterium]
MTDLRSQPPILRVPGWEAIPNLVHGFCGRRGGVSRGAFAELNLSRRAGDAPDGVQENWRRMTVAAGGLSFVTMVQVHGTRVVAVEDGADVGEADAMTTHASGLLLSVLTADCVPILLAAPAYHVVAAVHAGWRGTVGGIVARTVLRLERCCGVKPEAISAALGPAIGSCCYEVDGGIVANLEQSWGEMPTAILHMRGAKPMLDLRRANAILLARAGVPASRITSVGPCTRCATADYFSHRGALHTAAHATGRQLSFIGWRA